MDCTLANLLEMAVLGRKTEGIVHGTEGEEPEEYTLPENPTVTDYLMHPIRMGTNFSTRLQHNFEWRFAVQVWLWKSTSVPGDCSGL